MHIELDGDVWRIVEFQHVKPGKGGAFVRTKLKSLDSGAVVDKTFRAGEKFTRIHTEVKNVQYLYDAGDDVVFMDEETYEQIDLPRESVADVIDFMRLVERADADGRRQARPGVQLPASVELEVVETEPGDQGRHGLERDEAGEARDGRDRPGAALREHRRPHQGRPARGPLHLARLTVRAAAAIAAALAAGAACALALAADARLDPTFA